MSLGPSALLVCLLLCCCVVAGSDDAFVGDCTECEESTIDIKDCCELSKLTLDPSNNSIENELGCDKDEIKQKQNAFICLGKAGEKLSCAEITKYEKDQICVKKHKTPNPTASDESVKLDMQTTSAQESTTKEGTTITKPATTIITTTNPKVTTLNTTTSGKTPNSKETTTNPSTESLETNKKTEATNQETTTFVKTTTEIKEKKVSNEPHQDTSKTPANYKESSPTLSGAQIIVTVIVASLCVVLCVGLPLLGWLYSRKQNARYQAQLNGSVQT